MAQLSKHLAHAVCVVAVMAAASGCGSDADEATVYTDDALTCDHEIGTFDKMDTIERVGGLRNEDFSVRLAQSTRAGVVALVDGDVRKAFDQLNRAYGVTVVAKLDEDDVLTIPGLAQIRELVSSACGDAG